jgi:uncharacterized protein
MTHKGNSGISPLHATDRIIAIDALRGFAVLGILIMNIQSFSMPGAAYINPTAFGNLTDVNRLIWIISHVVASEKFMSIFAMVFGAGVILFYEKLKVGNQSNIYLHYRRMLWLLLFGMLHAYLLWYGDILVAYSLCGMLVFLLRKKKPSTLIWISFVFFIIPILFYTSSYLSLPMWSHASQEQILQSWKPEHDKLISELHAMQGGWLEQMKVRVPAAIFMQTSLFAMESFWRIMSMMLLGMALYKMKVLTGEQSQRSYLGLGFGGLLIGTFLTGIGVFLNFENEWGLRFSMFLGRHFNYIGSVASALGYIGFLMLISKSRHMDFLKNTLAVIGRMAFSNYILQTLICTFIFYGHGLGHFGKSGRIVQSFVVISVWLILTIFSLFWLKYFRFGPLEWAWRSLTYWKLQPLMKKG